MTGAPAMREGGDGSAHIEAAPGPELIGLQPGSLGRSVPVTVSLKMGVDRHCEPSGK